MQSEAATCCEGRGVVPGAGRQQALLSAALPGSALHPETVPARQSKLEPEHTVPPLSSTVTEPNTAKDKAE